MIAINSIFEKVDWKGVRKDIGKTVTFVGTGAALGALAGDQLPSYTVKPKPELSDAENVKRVKDVKSLARPVLASKGALVGLAANIGHDTYKTLKSKDKGKKE